MRIMIVMTGFFPGQKFGGPPVSVNNFCSLMNNHDCYIVTRNHDLGENDIPYKNINPGWNDRGNCKVLYLTDKEYGYRNYYNGFRSFKRIINELNPDLIYLQGLFQDCVIPCLALAKKYKIPTLLAPRGELCKGAFRKKYKKIPYIIFLKIVGLLDNVSYQSTIDEETEAVKNILGAESDKVWFLPNIPSIPDRDYSATIKESGYARLIFLSRIVPKKNLLFALECLKKINGNVEYDIYGSNEDKDYWGQCLKVIAELPSNIHVSYKGNINHEQVQSTFANYDAMLFPTKSENFGHAIVESFSVGCPPIISNQTPWSDLQDYNAGWAISLDNEDGFIRAIQSIIDNDNMRQRAIRENAKQYFIKKLEVEKIKVDYESALEGSIS